MLIVKTRYVTKTPFTEAVEGETVVVEYLEFVAVQNGCTYHSRLQIPLGDKSIYKYVETKKNWIDTLLQRRPMLERAIKEYFNAEPNELDQHLMKESVQHILDGKIVFST